MQIPYEEASKQFQFFAAVSKVDNTEITGYFFGDRIAPETVPQGKYRYECRHSDSVLFGKPVTIEERVTVNFSGTLITGVKLSFPDERDKYIPVKKVVLRRKVV